MRLSGKNSNLQKAFTLVELAIVIVIIGLLVGGVLQGQELIKQAQYRAIMRDVESYKASTATFLSKYNCLPGDCRNAYTFFSSKNCGTNAVIAAVDGNTGCNGNGNQTLTMAEGQLFWRHLSYANLTKVNPAAMFKTAATVGTDVPAISFGKATGVSALYSNFDNTSSTTCGFVNCMDTDPENVYGGIVNNNILVVGGTYGNTTTMFIGSVITPTEAFEFDTKFDDGVFRSGAISGHKGRLENNTAGMCAADGTQIGNAYNNSANIKNTVQCILVFKLGL